MNNLNLTPRARRHFVRLIQRNLTDRRRRVANMAQVGQVNQNPNPANFTLKGLSKWSKVGLDLTDSGFSKLHSKESNFEKDKKKYNLASESFKTYTENLIEKVERIHAVEQCMVNISNTRNGYVLKEYSSITIAMMKAKRDQVWPNQVPATVTDQDSANKFTDAQIKSSVLGAYIHDSLDEDSKRQLNAQSDLFKVKDLENNHYFDGPSYFHCISQLVDPDNGHLVSKVKKELRHLNAKDFGFDIKKMLAEFKTLTTRVVDLGGDYSTDDQFLDLWEAVSTMKEKEFTRFVKQLEDDHSAKERANRDSISEVIRKIGAKQTRMETKGEWNVVSQEDAMIMALTSLIEGEKI